jgi:hypothetical protein
MHRLSGEEMNRNQSPFLAKSLANYARTKAFEEKL